MDRIKIKFIYLAKIMKYPVIKAFYLWYTNSKLVYHSLLFIIGGFVVYHKNEGDS